MTEGTNAAQIGSTLFGKLTSFVVLLLLVFTVLAGTGENIHSRLLNLGVEIWDDYRDLRADMAPPSCVVETDLEARLDKLEAEVNTANEDALFAETFDRDAARMSLHNQQKVCAASHAAYQTNIEKVNIYVRVYRQVEQAFASLSLFAINQQHFILVVMLLLSAGVATAHKHHIAFRQISTRYDHYVSTSSQLVANCGLAYSAWVYHKGGLDSGVVATHPEVNITLITGAVLLAIMSLYQLLTPAKSLVSGGSAPKALLSIPIYTFMLLAAINHFYFQEGHPAGIAIYFTQLFQLTGLYLNIALYIWVGMLLKQTRLGERIFDVFQPWKLPPEVLAFVAIVIMAVPTAYTGASGIIIIAMGVVVYSELRRVGTRRQLALAVTAMTGSSGVVLRPCLLVIGIAMLNKEVVTDDLFHWGSRVFMLTLAVFLFYALLTRKDTRPIAPVREALRPSLLKLVPLAPYVAILLAVCLAYSLLLDAHLDEFSAPIILPALILAVIVFERLLWRYERDQKPLNPALSSTIGGAVGESVSGASVQIGALLMLMACSFAVGGILEQSGGSYNTAASISSPLVAMGVLVLLLVFIGMIMDPFGALILVTSTIAPFAYQSGIDPIHFWMTALVAFELGYLSPPVSLNHLLTRQVVGAEEVELAAKEGGNSFYYRHERILLPLLVMSTTLILVAFGPLLRY